MVDPEDMSTELYDDNYYMIDDVEYVEENSFSTERELNPHAMKIDDSNTTINFIKRLLGL